MLLALQARISGGTDQEDAPLWYFLGLPLGLDVFPGMSGPEARKRSGKPRPAPVSRPGSRLKSSASDPKTEAVEAPVPVTATRQCLVPVRLQRAKTSFPGQGTLRCAPCSFPPGVSKVSSACSARQRQSSRRSWSTPGLPCGTQPPQRRQPRRFSPNWAAGRDPPVFQSRATYSLSPC
jgi:hypothetical protein